MRHGNAKTRMSRLAAAKKKRAQRNQMRKLGFKLVQVWLHPADPGTCPAPRAQADAREARGLMPRVDWQSEIPAGLPWTDEDVRIYLALPVHLQGTSINADGVDARLIKSAISWSRTFSIPLIDVLRIRVQRDAAG